MEMKMPMYKMECLECGQIEDRRLTYAQFDAAKVEPIPCSCCQKPFRFAFSPGSLGFILKEGESGGWASKSIKENAYRGKRAIRMKQREKDHVFKSRLQPNYDGEETGTWKEAQEQARKVGGNLSASTYEPLVKKEQVSP
jgi:predicted nucleic acid-binding Zn ribbon protein